MNAVVCKFIQSLERVCSSFILLFTADIEEFGSDATIW